MLEIEKSDYRRYNPQITRIIREAPHYQQPKKAYIGMSNVITMCPREFALQHKNDTTILFPFATLFNFQTGFSSEAMLEWFLNDIAKTVLTNAEFRILADQVRIKVDQKYYTWHTGRTDQLYYLVEKGGIEGTILLEIKKMAATRFNNFKKHGYLSEEAAMFQLFSCMRDWPEDSEFEKPTMGAIVGISLEPPDLWDYTFDWSEDRRNEMLSRFEGRLELIEKVIADKGKFVPNHFYSKESFQCKGCSVKALCRPSEVGEITKADLETKELSDLEEMIPAYIAANEMRKAWGDVTDIFKVRFEEVMAAHEAGKLVFDIPDATFKITKTNSVSEHLDKEDLKIEDPALANKLIWSTEGQTTYHRYKLKDAAKSFKIIAEESKDLLHLALRAADSPAKYLKEDD